MVNLSTTYMGVPIKNPLIVASGPTTHTPEICAKAAKFGWAGVVLKTYFGEDVVAAAMADPLVPFKAPRPVYTLTDYEGMDKWQPPVPEKAEPRSITGKLGKMPKNYGLVSLLQLTRRPVKYYAAPQSWFNGERYLGYINRTKELVKDTGADCKVIASIISFTEEGWEKQCDMINKSDADMVELCFSAPAAVYTDPKTGETAQVSSYPQKVEEWARFCVEHIGIPVAAKFPGDCPDPLSAAQAAVRAGVKGIQFGGVAPFAPRIPPIVINPDTLELGFMPGNPFGWTRNAHWAVPFVCGDIAHLRMSGVELDISGCGGIRHYRDILRLIMAGSDSVQVCTATMVEGVDVGHEYLNDIEAWMENKGYQSISEIQGIIVDKDKLRVDSSKFEADVAQISGGPTPKVRLEVDKDKCVNCGWCEPCCFFLAIKMEKELPVIDDKLCEVCGMCGAVCPTDVFSIVARE